MSDDLGVDRGVGPRESREPFDPLRPSVDGTFVIEEAGVDDCVPLRHLKIDEEVGCSRTGGGERDESLATSSLSECGSTFLTLLPILSRRAGAMVVVSLSLETG